MRRWLLTSVSVLAMSCAFDPRGAGPGEPDATDAPVGPDAPPGDQDTDGVTDDRDNCPALANPDQHDEDGDTRGDVCDPCPQLGGAADTDGDGDGVGDGCDPNPTVGGDRLVYFEPFATGTGLPAGWSVHSGVAGRWAVRGDALERASSSDFDLIRFTPPGPGRVTVDAVVEVTAVGAGARHVGVLVDVLTVTGGLAYVHCAYRDDQNGRELWTFDRRRTAFWKYLQSAADPGAGVGARRLVSSVVPSGQRCRATRDASTVTLVGGEPTFGGGDIGLVAANLGLRVPYVAVYRSP